MRFGTDAVGLDLRDGRIDEVALFDRALSDAEGTELYQAKLEEIGNSRCAFSFHDPEAAKGVLCL